MKGDFTRWTFKPAKKYSPVLMQQGRVLLDADWNEQREIEREAERALARDLIGSTGGLVDKTGLPGFAVEADGQGLRLNPGRYYVDGIPCQLEEYAWVEGVPNPAIGEYLVYLDVFERHLTHIDDPEIKETALGGPDHTTRVQVVTRACLLPLGETVLQLPTGVEIPPAVIAQARKGRRKAMIGAVGQALKSGIAPLQPIQHADLGRASPTDCERMHDPRELAKWIEGTRGSMEASLIEQPPRPDPCDVPTVSRYRGLENQLYRVEIHKGGTKGVTFKWSRDNGSVVTAWTGYDPATRELFVGDLGADEERGFRGQIIELVDEAHELALTPGLMAKTTVGGSSNSLVVDTLFKPDGTVLVEDLTFDAQAIRPRVRRWDGGPRRIDQLDKGSDWIPLEDGIRVRFASGAGEEYRSGDYWLIPARTVDGSIEWSPPGFHRPHGPRHAYAALAVISGNDKGWRVTSRQRTFPSVTSLVQMRYAGGDGQQGVAGQPLGEPLRVQVTNGGIPFPGAVVVFQIETGDGELSPGDQVLTSPEGLAEVRWTFGRKEHSQRVTATLFDECNKPTHQVVHFSAHESQADEVRYRDEERRFDTVQEALEVLHAARTLYYVGGSGQAAILGAVLPVPLTVRVANEGTPVSGAIVRFRVIRHPEHVDELGRDAPDIDASRGGTLSSVGIGHRSEPWADSQTDIRTIFAKTDELGLAHVKWTYATHAGETPLVEARLLADGGTDTASFLYFSAVLQTSAEVGLHILEVNMAESPGDGGLQRQLFNDSTVDPYHLLGGISVCCDAEPDIRTLRGKGTAYLRIRVPYGSPVQFEGAGSDPPPLKAHVPRPGRGPIRVQHYDEHIVAGDVSVKDKSIIWTPSAAARRMLTSVGPGPQEIAAETLARMLMCVVVPQACPLPIRLFMHGGGEQRVRATLTIEGDFVCSKAIDGKDRRQLDGETRGRPIDGRTELAFPSGDHRAGGDFRTWFWIEGRVWQSVPLGFAVAPPHATIVATTTKGGQTYDVCKAWVANGRLEWSLLNSVPVQGEVRAHHEGVGFPVTDGGASDLPGQVPSMWRRTGAGGVTDGFTVGVYWNGRPAVVRFSGLAADDGLQIPQFVPDDIFPGAHTRRPSPPGRPPAGPRGTEFDGGDAVAWIDISGGLHAALCQDGTWTDLTGPVLSEASERPASARRRRVKFRRDPVVFADPDGKTLHIIAAEREARRIHWFRWSRKPGMLELGLSNAWNVEELPTGASSNLLNSGASLYGSIAGASGQDEEGVTVRVVAWYRRNGEVMVLRQHGDEPWSLESVPRADGRSLDADRPLAVAVDALGVIHIIATTTRADRSAVIDFWSDRRTPWTTTDLSERGVMNEQPIDMAAMSSSDGKYLVVTAGTGESAWLGPPRVLYAPAGAAGPFNEVVKAMSMSLRPPATP